MRRIYERFGLEEGQATTTSFRIDVLGESPEGADVPDDLSSIGSFEDDASDENLAI